MSEEARVVTHVSQRLTTRFPQIPTQRVSEAVNSAYHEFDGARIRDFIEILVERDASAELNHSVR